MKLFLAVFLLSYLYHAMGITVGYHRLLAHRSFKVPLWLEYLIVSGGYLCFEGSPIRWVTVHRLHHRYSDKPGDPHSPKDGTLHAFIGWMFEAGAWDDKQGSQTVCPDLWRDWLYRGLNLGHTNYHAMLCLGICTLFRCAILVLFGPIAMFANLAAALLSFSAPLFVNSVCHLPAFGYQNFDSKDESRNVWWVGLLAMGEGWHNNHHALPQSARHGLRPDELDISWLTIRAMQILRLAKDIHLPKDEIVAARQLGVREIFLADRGEEVLSRGPK